MSSEQRGGWGGKRTPAGGRPKAERRMQKTSVTLWPEQIEQLRAIGGGSVSDGIRRLLEDHEEDAAKPEGRAAS